MDYYMTSISCQQKLDTICVQQIMDVLIWLTHQIPSLKILENQFETGKVYNQLHLHMLCTVKKHFRWKPFTQYGAKQFTKNTFHIDWKRIYNYNKALSYIQKDMPKDNKIIKYYQKHFFDQDLQEFTEG